MVFEEQLEANRSIRNIFVEANNDIFPQLFFRVSGQRRFINADKCYQLHPERAGPVRQKSVYIPCFHPSVIILLSIKWLVGLLIKKEKKKGFSFAIVSGP